VSLRAAIDLSLARLRAPGTLSACLLALSFELGVALLERAQGTRGAADRALMGGAFGVSLPLLCYFLVTRSCAGQSLRGGLHALSRHGLDRYSLALGLALPPALVASGFAALSGVLVVLVTRALGDPALGADLLSCVWIGLVAGLAYVAAFVGASGIGRRGQGRAYLLAADFLLGAGSSLAAAPWPRGHVRNLLGGAPVLELSQGAALVVLLGTSFACLWLGMLRTQR
jgi:hypothetical protein